MIDETLIDIDAAQLENRSHTTLARITVKRADGKRARCWISVHLAYNGKVWIQLRGYNKNTDVVRKVSPAWLKTQ